MTLDKIDATLDEVDFLRKSDYDSALVLTHQTLAASQKRSYTKGMARSYYFLADLYQLFGEYDSSLLFLEEARKRYVQIDDKVGYANCINIEGYAFSDRGLYERAIEIFQSEIDYAEEHSLKRNIGLGHTGIAICRYWQGQYDKAIERYRVGGSILYELGDTVNYMSLLLNIGALHAAINQYDKAIESYEEGLAISGDKYLYMSADFYGNIGVALMQMNRADEALGYVQKALNIRKEIGIPAGIAQSYSSMATLYLKMGQPHISLDFAHQAYGLAKENNLAYDKAFYAKTVAIVLDSLGEHQEAIKYCDSSLWAADELGAWDMLRDGFSLMSLLQSKVGNYEEALGYQHKFNAIRDSIFNRERDNAIQAEQTRWQTETKIMENEKLKAENALSEEKLEKSEAETEAEKAKSNLLLIILIAAGVAAIGAFYGFNRVRLAKKETEKQKEIAEDQRDIANHQREQIAEQHREIRDSINYAKRIQQAILPSDSLVVRELPDSFILYKPKDVVAGDFYWLEPHEDLVYFAAADCTGHGVPGAMVSVVCSNALTKALIEEGITQPSKILDRTRELVINQFARSDEEVKDGMDISLGALNLQTRELIWAGANNPLWIVKPAKDNELVEIKGDKQPIGKYAEPKPFNEHRVKLDPGDRIYLFTDGYADQFGGERGKKFKYKAFKALLANGQALSMGDLKVKIDEEFETWRGDLEQVDDVCVIGVSV